MKCCFSIVLFFAWVALFAQRESSIWYFGENAGLDFTTGFPQLLQNGALTSNEGSAAISDRQGNLLFYTNGVTVWNRNHNVMANGNGLNGDVSTTQSAVIVPQPNNDNSYYIFTAANENGPFGINYSIVDMGLEGGFGAITTKNAQLDAPTTEKLTAISHSNGIDIWIVIHQSNNDVFVAYLLTETGLDPNPTVSAEAIDLGSLDPNPARNNSIGYMKASPDGEHLVVCHKNYGAELLLFDSSSGEVNLPIKISDNKDVYGAAFSPSGEVLYLSIEAGAILQYDLTADDIPASETLIQDSHFDTGALQLALDGKIYIANYLRPHLSVINNPDVLGAGCNFSYGSVNLGSGISDLGLPNFVQSFFVSYVEAEHFCLGENTAFELSFNQAVSNISWDFGDGTFGTGEQVEHQYANPGEYFVQVTFEVDSELRTDYKFVNIYPTPTANTPESLSVCSSNEDFYVDLSLADQEILGQQDPSVYFIDYYRTEDEAISEENPLGNGFVGDEQEYEIFARVYIRYNPECFALSNFTVTANQLPASPLDSSYTICENGEPLVLDGGDFQSWQWIDAEGRIISRRREISITQPGQYRLNATYNGVDFSCDTSFLFTVEPAATIEGFDHEVQGFSDLVTLRVNAYGSGDFEYSIDGIVFQTTPSFQVPPGRYTLTVRDTKGCTSLQKDIVVLGYNRFFTPNGDNSNERWQIIASEAFTNPRTRIFNRYGQLLVELKDGLESWDGTVNGKPLPSGEYWFRFEYDEGPAQNGHFALKR